MIAGTTVLGRNALALWANPAFTIEMSAALQAFLPQCRQDHYMA